MTPAEFHELAVERMAEEIYETQRQDHDGAPWALLSNKSYEKTRIRHDAMAALAALASLAAEHGFKLLGPETTPDMVIQGGIAWTDAEPEAETPVDTAHAAWTAMHAAAPDLLAGEGKRDEEAAP